MGGVPPGYNSPAEDSTMGSGGRIRPLEPQLAVEVLGAPCEGVLVLVVEVLAHLAPPMGSRPPPWGWVRGESSCGCGDCCAIIWASHCRCSSWRCVV